MFFKIGQQERILQEDLHETLPVSRESLKY
jgi:hypothetical protein